MNLRDLEYVAAIDRYRNFGRAAEACHVSQPSLSSQVKKLEERLGVELFARTSSGVFPTDAGARIVSTAKEVLRHAQRITDTAAEYHDPLAAPLRVGIIPTLAPFVLPHLAKSVRAVAENIRMIFRERPTADLLAELEGRAIDVALLSGPVSPTGYQFTPVFREPLALMVCKSHYLANRSSISAAEIPIEEMLLLTNEHCLRAEAVALCNDKNIGLDVPDGLHATNFLTMSHYLCQGVGCTFVPALACETIGRANPDVHFIMINEMSHGRDIGFVSRIGCPRENILKALCDQIREHPPEKVTALH